MGTQKVIGTYTFLLTRSDLTFGSDQDETSSHHAYEVRTGRPGSKNMNTFTPLHSFATASIVLLAIHYKYQP